MSKKSTRKKKPEPGWIYCLVNPSFPDKVKIGYTTGSVEARMAQLDGTSLPTPFRLAGKWKSRNVTADEKFIHRKLGKYRIRTNREFFNLSGKEAVSRVSKILHKSPQHKKGGFWRFIRTLMILGGAIGGAYWWHVNG